MEKPSETSTRCCEHRPAGKVMRRNVLLLATVILALAFPPALYNVSNKSLLVAAFAIPALQIGFALSQIEVIQDRESLMLKLLAFSSAVAIFTLAHLAATSPEVWLLISFAYIFAGFSFEFGIGLAPKLQFPLIYSQFAISLAIVMARVGGREVTPGFWAMTLAPVPLTLLLLVISSKYDNPAATETKIPSAENVRD